MAEERSYRIGEVAEMLQLKPYVLRFWETEFPQLAPGRAESGQRLYSENDVNMLRRIRQLLHEQGMTIEGARKMLDGSPDSGESGANGHLADKEFMTALARELESVRQLLDTGIRS